MKNPGRLVKKCGGLRGLCVGLKTNPPQRNRESNFKLDHLRVVAGGTLYPMYARTRARTHVCVVGNNPPHPHAEVFNSPNDIRLRCGALPIQPHAVPPLIASNPPQMHFNLEAANA